MRQHWEGRHFMTQHGRPIRRRPERGLTSAGAALAAIVAPVATVATVAVTAAAAVAASDMTRTPGTASHTQGTTSRTPGDRARARAARTLTVNDNGKLHLLHASGSVLSEEGPVSGTLLGTARVSLNVGEDVTATFTIHARGGGSIVGHGSAALHSAGRYSSFAGSLTVTGGTGRYAHAHGAGRLYGTLERRYDEVVFQTRGTLDY